MEYISAKKLLAKNKHPGWFATDYNLNIYRGCCHGCIYCDSRSDCYHVEDFDQVKAKKDALILLEQELRTKKKSGVVGSGAMSDPYNPFEKTEQLTGGSLKLLDRYRYGAAIATKSPLITRDIPVLRSISSHSPVLCKVTVTTADDQVSRRIEPGVQVSSERFQAVRELSAAGIYTGILLMPVLPFITDTADNIRAIVRQAAEAGARFIYAGFGVTLRTNQMEHYYKQLDRLYPGLRKKYIDTYQYQYSCGCRDADELWRVFKAECRQHGLLFRMEDIIRDYRAPYQVEQLSLF